MTRAPGYILVPVVMMIAVIAAVAFMLNRQVSMGGAAFGVQHEVDKVFVGAQAGLVHASWLARNGACIGDANTGTVSLEDVTYLGEVKASASTTTVTLSPDRDAYIDEGSPTSNFGSASPLEVRTDDSGSSKRALYHFDLSGITGGDRVASASLYLYVDTNDPQSLVEIRVLSEPWVESTVTWDTFSSTLPAQVHGAIPEQSTGGQWVEINITGMAQGWLNSAADNHGLVLSSTAVNLLSKYASKEASASEQPYLDVTTTAGTVSPVVLTGSSSLQTLTSRTLSRSDQKIPQTPALALYQPGWGVDDTYVRQGASAVKNYGAQAKLEVEDAGKRNALVRFDLDGLEHDLHVGRVTLDLYLDKGGTVVNGVLAVHAVTRDWVEGVELGDPPVAGLGATFNDYDGANPWATAGGDYESTALDSVVLPTFTEGWYRWDVTERVQSWLARTPNYGFLIRASSGQVDKIEFASSDHSNASLHPRLTFERECECGSPCVQPKGNGDVMVVVGDPASLSASDVKKIALIEGWGYAVQLVDDGITQTDLDDIIFGFDAVYISESSNAGTVATKFTNQAVGVVNEEKWLNDELGISASFADLASASITVDDTDHFITRLMPLGSLDIYDQAMKGARVSGTLAGGLDVLASWGGSGGLVALEAGAARYPSGVSAGRRVTVPVAENTDWQFLNDRGRLLLQRSLQWATGNMCNFLDQFNAKVFSNDDGSRAWKGPWVEVGESDGADDGDIRVRKDQSEFQLRLKKSSEGAEREADLSGVTSALLILDYRRKNLDDIDDYVTIEMSATGTAGPWTEIDRITGPGTDASYVSTGYDISAFISANTALRLLTSSDMEGEIWWDNVQIKCLW